MRGYVSFVNLVRRCEISESAKAAGNFYELDVTTNYEKSCNTTIELVIKIQ